MPNFLTAVLMGAVGIALSLYFVLGGADYGAGLLELLPARGLRHEQKIIINHALGPVWEANHMWLIIIVVILFVGFPEVFHVVMVALHIPMVCLLWGIVLRGAVFTFRHYDANKTRQSQRIYTALFGLSSLWTSLWIGVIAASLFRGHIDPQSTDVWLAYGAPWWGLFPLVVGFFVCVQFAFLASVYLIGETRDNRIRHFFVKRAAGLNLAVYFMGAGVFWAGWRDNNDFLSGFGSSPTAKACLAAAVLSCALQWGLWRQRAYLGMRMAAAAQNTALLLSWYVLHAPSALLLKSGPMTFFAAVACDATVRQLLLALGVGSLLVFPSLFMLLVVFKHKTPLAPQ